ncbi:hypothetical protein THRCLA_06536 [Thraustotheca clavata]|uniref:Ankyrin repeat protein n=1 Tax=Thraustotheca clavata TaxID=74557 RepID=A0A1V9ZN45_9STRA|nr:hypothetical protein THRCLA_06536 [Thraustotheca clavata]
MYCGTWIDKLELELKHDPDLVNAYKSQLTPLCYAIKHKQKHVIHFLLENTQDLDIFKNEIRALFQAIIQNDNQSLLLLLDFCPSTAIPKELAKELLLKAVNSVSPESAEIILRREATDIQYIQGLLNDIAITPASIKFEIANIQNWPFELIEKANELCSLPVFYHLITKGKSNDLQWWLFEKFKHDNSLKTNDIDTSIAEKDTKLLQVDMVDDNNESIIQPQENPEEIPIWRDLQDNAVLWAVEHHRADNLFILLNFNKDLLHKSDNAKKAWEAAIRNRYYIHDKLIYDNTLQCIEILAKELEKDIYLPFNILEENLYNLAQDNQWDRISYILSFGEQLSAEILNTIDVSGNALVHVICQEGKVDILKLLVKQENFNPQLPSNEGEYPLYIANKNKKIDLSIRDTIVNLLLYAGANHQLLLEPKHKRYEDQKHLNKIIDTKALKDLRQPKKLALQCAISNPLPIAVITTLLNEDPKLGGDTPLILAAKQDRHDCIKMLLDAKADIDAINDLGETALRCAATKGFKMTTNALIDALADINIKAKDNLTVVEKLQKDKDCHIKWEDNQLKLTPQACILKTILEIRQHPDQAYQEKLTQYLLDLTAEKAFEGSGFSRAVNFNPELARDFLNDCVDQHRHMKS